MTLTRIALIALLAVAAPTLAEEPKGAAGELARLLMPKKTWDEGLQGLTQSVQARMESHPGAKLKYPADFTKRVRAELETVLPYDSLLQIHAKELGASYTEAELKELATFYRSPVGQKSLSVMPQLSQKVAIATQQQVESKMPEVMTRLSELAKSSSGTPAPAGHGAMPPPAQKPAAPATAAPAAPPATK